MAWPRLIFFFNDTPTTEIYTRPYTLSLHDALPISDRDRRRRGEVVHREGRCHERRSEEHTSELQSHGLISYAVFCLKKKRCSVDAGTDNSLLKQVSKKNKNQFA